MRERWTTGSQRGHPEVIKVGCAYAEVLGVTGNQWSVASSEEM
jgi:hypothetical protein